MIPRTVKSIILSMVVASACLTICGAMVLAQPPGTVNLLRDLPPDVQVKIVELAQILGSAIQNGQLTDAQIKATVNSGDVEALVRSLGPDAAHLLQDIAAGLKANYSDEQLHLILGGLTGVK